MQGTAEGMAEWSIDLVVPCNYDLFSRLSCVKILTERVWENWARIYYSASTTISERLVLFIKNVFSPRNSECPFQMVLAEPYAIFTIVYCVADYRHTWFITARD